MGDGGADEHCVYQGKWKAPRVSSNEVARSEFRAHMLAKHPDKHPELAEGSKEKATLEVETADLTSAWQLVREEPSALPHRLASAKQPPPSQGPLSPHSSSGSSSANMMQAVRRRFVGRLCDGRSVGGPRAAFIFRAFQTHVCPPIGLQGECPVSKFPIPIPFPLGHLSSLTVADSLHSPTHALGTPSSSRKALSNPNSMSRQSETRGRDAGRLLRVGKWSCRIPR